MANLSLRAKSLIALAIACVVVLLPASWLGWLAMQSVQRHFGEAYAQNLALLNRERLLAPVRTDLALSLRLAASPITQRWIEHDQNPALRELFFAEAETYRQALHDRAYFLVSDESLHYYFNSEAEPTSITPRYQLDRNDPADEWYFRVAGSELPYQININTDQQLGLTRVWINVPIRNAEGHTLGLAGSSLDLSRFLSSLGEQAADGITPILARADGAIQAHPDRDRIAFNTAAHEVTAGHSLAGLVPASEQPDLQQALEAARNDPLGVTLTSLTVDGVDQIVAITYIPDLDWFGFTALDLRSAHVISPYWFWLAVAGLALLLASLLSIFGYGVERLVLRPIRQLQQSARALAAGNYHVSLPSQADEIGDLSRSFGEMARRVEQHTRELEDRVRHRTRELEAANLAMAQSQTKISQSIEYAALIQSAILPDRQLAQAFGANHFVIWQPRDVVGGDFYVFYESHDVWLLGLVDCAGHGVPGALMTMLVKAALDRVIQECRLENPAELLQHVDQVMRAMLANSHLPRGLATNAEAGLLLADKAKRQLRYAGARIPLYTSDGQEVQEYRGDKRALCDRRVGKYHNIDLPLCTNTTYYLTTDGFLDQAGGEQGFGFGSSRFRRMLQANANLPLAQQAHGFKAALAAYQGSQPQRDDITLLAFRFNVN